MKDMNPNGVVLYSGVVLYRKHTGSKVRVSLPRRMSGLQIENFTAARYAGWNVVDYID